MRNESWSACKPRASAGMQGQWIVTSCVLGSISTGQLQTLIVLSRWMYSALQGALEKVRQSEHGSTLPPFLSPFLLSPFMLCPLLQG